MQSVDNKSMLHSVLKRTADDSALMEVAQIRLDKEADVPNDGFAHDLARIENVHDARETPIT